METIISFGSQLGVEKMLHWCTNLLFDLGFGVFFSAGQLRFMCKKDSCHAHKLHSDWIEPRVGRALYFNVN